MRRTRSLSLSEDKGILTPGQLEKERRKYNQHIRTEAPILIDEIGCKASRYFTGKPSVIVTEGNYSIINGRKVPIEQYGEKIMEEYE
jgi:hypothetical protein